MSYNISTEGFWIVGTIFAIILCLCLLMLLGGFTSSYSPKRSLSSIILRGLCMCVLMTIFLLLLLLFIEYIYDKVSVKYGFYLGAMSVLIVPVLLIILVIVFPQCLQSYKTKKWCRNHQNHCSVELQHVSSILFPSKQRVILPVSVDKMPIKMTTEAVLTGKTLYILPGKHLIEFLVSKGARIGRRLPIPSVENRIELSHQFKTGGCYICKLNKQKNTLTIEYKGQRR